MPTQVHKLFAAGEPYYVPPTPAEIEKYQTVEYPEWLDKIKLHINTIINNTRYISCHCNISIHIDNIGRIPAENVLVKFEASDGFRLIRTKDADAQIDNLNKTKLPSPPAAPKGSWTLRTSLYDLGLPQSIKAIIESQRDKFISTPHIFFNPPKRDKNSFYWKEEDNTLWIFECDEFRHKARVETFDLTVLVPPMRTISNGIIKCFITAKNMPDNHIKGYR